MLLKNHGRVNSHVCLLQPVATDSVLLAIALAASNYAEGSGHSSFAVDTVVFADCGLHRVAEVTKLSRACRHHAIKRTWQQGVSFTASLPATRLLQLLPVNKEKVKELSRPFPTRFSHTLMGSKTMLNATFACCSRLCQTASCCLPSPWPLGVLPVCL